MAYFNKSSHVAEEALASTYLLSHPVCSACLEFYTDVSCTGISASLEHFVDGSWGPLAFIRRALPLVERHYSTFDWEMLATYHAVSHFQSSIKGWRCFFTLITELWFKIFAVPEAPVSYGEFISDIIPCQ